MKTKDEKIERLHAQLKLANAALNVATNNVVEARKNVKVANDRLIAMQEENRKLRLALMESYEAPPLEEVDRIATKLERSGGFVSKELACDAALLIRRLWRSSRERNS